VEKQSASSTIEYLCDGLTLQTIFDGRVYLFTVTHSSFEIENAWFERVVQIIQQHSPHPIHFMYNGTVVNSNFSNRSRAKVIQLVELFPDQVSYTSIIIKNHALNTMVRLFAMAARTPWRHLSFFSSVEKALEWHERYL
jgi:hypothetical protein